jgi:hypothetical protein
MKHVLLKADAIDMERVQLALAEINEHLGVLPRDGLTRSGSRRPQVGGRRHRPRHPHDMGGHANPGQPVPHRPRSPGRGRGAKVSGRRGIHILIPVGPDCPFARAEGRETKQLLETDEVGPRDRRPG